MVTAVMVAAGAGAGVAVEAVIIGVTIDVMRGSSDGAAA
jgi:hypothetical protein